MRLVSFESAYGARWGAVDGDEIVDLNAAYAALLASRGASRPWERARADVPSDATEFLAEGGEAAGRAAEAVAFARARRGRGYLYARRDVSLLPVVPHPPKVICVGLNYRDHAEETGAKIPERPVFFSKFPSCLIGAGQPIVIPRVSSQVDYEGEFVIVIGRPGRYIREEDAEGHVAGYTIMNDTSVRDYQMRTSQWLIGKTFDRTTPVGPELVTRDEVPRPGALRLAVTVNGRVLQNSNTSNMIFSVPRLIASISEILTLEPGDLIATGTPAGVGFARKPPIFLKDGDRVAVEIDPLGRLENPVQQEARTPQPERA
ncbi:MAG TPA: fumarylacetoacetate hydrolase family protein [bacterium]|nr:fumarylacetoacetate hydrolase family protein [bacterium]